MLSGRSPSSLQASKAVCSSETGLEDFLTCSPPPAVPEQVQGSFGD